MRKTKRKKKNTKLKYIVWITVIAIIVLLATSATARQRLTVLYNICRVALERESDFIFAEKHFGVDLPKGYHIHGIDVSRYQGKINWKQVAAAGTDEQRISFAFIKASEGRTLSDRYFSYNMENARKNDIICGAYHYYKPHISSTEQAENFISLVKLQEGDLPPVLDIEETGSLGKENMRKGIKNWLQLVEKHYCMKPIIYTSNSFHSDYLSGDEFKDYPFWIAHYYESELHTNSDWIFWQHSDKARVNGINHKVDINVFNGSIADLIALGKK